MKEIEFLLERVWSETKKTRYGLLTVRVEVRKSNNNTKFIIYKHHCIVIDTKINAPISDFTRYDDAKAFLLDFVPELTLTYEDPNIFWSDISQLPKYLKGNKAGLNQEELEWEEFKRVYNWDKVE